MILSPWRNTARSSISSVSSGASSGSTQGLRLDKSPELFCFFSMAIPHRDEVTGLTPLGPDHHHRVTVQPADSDLAHLAIAKPLADHGRCVARKYLFRIGREINPTFLQGDETLGWVEGDLHIKCTYMIRWRQAFCIDDNSGIML